MGILQQSVDITPLKRFEPSRSVLDLIDNMRSKIYGFFCKLGFGSLPGLEDEDYVTLCIIENFLDFKMGEIWQEIMTELDMEDVKLISTDSEATDTILRATEERALGMKSRIICDRINDGLCLAVAATQNFVLEQYQKQDLQIEKLFYNEVRKENSIQFK